MLLLSQESCFRMEACAWQGVGHGVGVSGHLLGGSDLRWRQPFGVCGEGLESVESAERTLSGYDENVEALPYRCM